MDSLEQRIEREGKAVVKARIAVKMKWALKRRDSLQLTANQIRSRLDEIDIEVQGYLDDLRNMEDLCTSKSSSDG